jgi:hypothetical protein
MKRKAKSEKLNIFITQFLFGKFSKGDASSPMLSSSALEYGITKVQAIVQGFKLSGKYRLMVHAEVVLIQCVRKVTAHLGYGT